MLVLFYTHCIRSNEIDKEFLVDKIALPRAEMHDGKPLLHLNLTKSTPSISNKKMQDKSHESIAK